MRNLVVSLIAVVLLATTGCAKLGFSNWEQWSTYDKTAYGVAWATRGADILQTRYTYDHPELFTESNSIINSICDDKNCATAVLIGAEWIIGITADKLPPAWRSLLLTTEAGKNAKIVFDNNSIGVKFAW